MPQPLNDWNGLFSDGFSRVNAYTLSIGCSLAYDLSNTAAIDSYKTAIGASNYQVSGATGMFPACIVFYGPQLGTVVCGAGLSNESQFLRYLMASYLTANTAGDGFVSAFLLSTCLANKAALMTKIYGFMGLNVGGRLVLAGHSAFGALATLIAQDFKKNYTATMTVKGVYTLGSTRPGSQLFRDNSHNDRIYNIRNQNDFVPTLPPGVGSEIVTSTDATGTQTTERRHFGYVQPGTCYTLDQGAFVTDPNFNSVGDFEFIQALWGLVASRGLPQEHNIQAYINNLSEPAAAQARADHDAAKREQLNNLQDVPVPAQPADVDLAIGTLPNPRPAAGNPTPPSGGTVVYARSTGAVFGGVATVPLGKKPKRAKRAHNHDGRAKRKVKRVVQDLVYLLAHDDKAKYKRHHGTQFISDPKRITDSQWEAIFEIIAYFRELSR